MTRRVAIVMATNMGCHRQALRGVSEFALSRPEWQLQHYATGSAYLSRPKSDVPAGLLLGPIADCGVDEMLADTPGPVVGLYCGGLRRHSDRLGEFGCRDEVVGRLAAEHLMQRGFARFGAVGPDLHWSRVRTSAFAATLREAGHVVDPLLLPTKLADDNGVPRAPAMGAAQSWLAQLDKPIAIFASNDHTARRLAQIAGNLGLEIPEQVAVLGVDDDEFECELNVPSLSSVSIPWRRMGFAGAELLEGYLRGAQPRVDGPELVLFDPDQVVVRRSTDTTATEDAEVRSAVRFIQENAHRPLSVEDVLRVVLISRRSLELRFRAALGRTPLEEIRRAHVERAKVLLLRTELPMPEVARLSGFGGAIGLSKTFKQLVGVPPTAFRGAGMSKPPADPPTPATPS